MFFAWGHISENSTTNQMQNRYERIYEILKIGGYDENAFKLSKSVVNTIVLEKALGGQYIKKLPIWFIQAGMQY